MQIALTKKLADAIKTETPPTNEEEKNSLFSWTANWITTWDNRKAKDMLVLVNHASRFTVTIYQVKRKDLKNIEKIMTTGIKNTLLAMNLNPDIVKDYMQKAGEVEFVKNSNRSATAWVNQSGRESAIYVGNTYNGIDEMFDDTLGTFVNNGPVKSPKGSDDYIWPYEVMFEELSELFGKPIYKYQAFELLATLDLGVYKATRRIIVPADIDFRRLHKVLQQAFDWEDYHLFDFTIFDEKQEKPVARLVPFEEDLDFDPIATLMEDQTLADYFPKYKKLLYTYDMGDNWEHEVELVRVIDDHDEESPYLLEVEGQAPPEDVGGVGGFQAFQEIMLNPDHPDHREMNDWAGYWSLELSDFKKRPRVIRE